MKRIVICGGMGFIGHHLARKLKKEGNHVRIVDIEKSKYVKLSDFDEFLELDLTDPHNCKEATWGMDEVYQLAALNGSIELTTTDKAHLVHNNALINLNMADACIYSGIKKIFYSSSACVYPIELQDSDEIHPLKESDAYPANPDSEYGWEKLFSERVYQDYNKDYGLEIRIARFINVYGTECLIDTLRSKAPLALTRKVIEAGNGGKVKIWGDGGQSRTFCYIDDLLNGIDLIMKSNITDPINLGSDELITIDGLVDKISEIEGISVKKVHQLNKVQGVRTRTPDLTKINKLGWKRKVSLKKGITKVNKFVHSQIVV